MRCKQGGSGKGQVRSYTGGGDGRSGKELENVVIEKGQVLLANKDHECGGR